MQIISDQREPIMHRVIVFERTANLLDTGELSFLIVRNDDYLVGDSIKLRVLEVGGRYKKHVLNGAVFKIKYVLEDLGLRRGYVALSITQEKSQHEE